MSQSEFNKIFSKRLAYYLRKNNMTQNDLAQKLGVGAASVSNWRRGLKSPRMDKVDTMCELFQCRRSDLLEEPELSCEDSETVAITQALLKSKELRLLFNAAKDASTEDLETLYTLLLALKRKEYSNSQK